MNGSKGRSTLSTIDIRPVHNRAELEACFDLWGTVFPEDRSFFQDRIDNDSAYQMDTTWAAFVGGTLASAVQIFPYLIWVEDVQLKVGGIGNVATLPEYRGRRLAQNILRQQCNWMTAQGYDLSLLFTGIHAFYEQVGWYAAGTRSFVVHRDAIISSVSVRLNEYVIEPFQARDLDEVAAVYTDYNRHRTGSWIRAKSYWEGQLQWTREDLSRFLVAKQLGQVVAYIRTVVDPQNRLHIRELCYDVGHGRAAIDLVRTVLEHTPSAETVQARIPSDHALAAELERLGATVETGRYTMWRTFDERPLLHKIRPLLSRRLCAGGAGMATINGRVTVGAEQGRNVGVPSRILFRSERQQSVLCLGDGHVHVESAESTLSYDIEIVCHGNDLVTLLLEGAQALESVTLRDNPYLQTLFPEQHGILWASDFF